MCHSTHVEVKGELWESILSFNLAGPENQTLIIKSCNKQPYPLNQLAGPYFCGLGGQECESYTVLAKDRAYRYPIMEQGGAQEDSHPQNPEDM